jgi:hypothetical protein
MTHKTGDIPEIITMFFTTLSSDDGSGSDGRALDHVSGVGGVPYLVCFLRGVAGTPVTTGSATLELHQNSVTK